MKKLKYLLFFLPLFIGFNVFAQNVTSSVRCTYNSSGSTYYGDPNDGLNSAQCYDMGTRYSPRLGYLEFYLPTSVMSFTAGKSYTVTMNMATNDWRNHIMLQNVRYVNSSGNVITTSPLPSVSNFRFISRKQIKFDFKLPSGTIYPYLRFIISSPTYANPDPDISSSTYMTGETNWNLSSIDISPVSSSSGSSTTTPTPSPSNQDIINNNNQNTEDIMNNNNQNTSDIINNNNSNTQEIINNQNELLGNCYKNLYNKNDIVSGKWLTSDNWINDDSSWSYSNFISITPNTNYTSLYYGNSGSAASIVFYDSNKNFISGITHNDRNVINWTSPSNAYYVRDSIPLSSINQFMIIKGTHSNFEYLSYNQEKCFSKLDDTTIAINDVNNSINNSNIDNGVGEGFFDNFTSQDFGLSQIITIPLNTIQGLTSKTCVPLQIPIPFTNSNITLPCMTEIYETKFPSIYNLWKIVSFGIVAYLIAIDIFHIVKGFKDPESDKVEVLDL